MSGALRIVPLTPEYWPAFAELLGRQGPCSRCWCMYTRIGPAYRKRPPQSNRDDFRRVVHEGPPPGLLAFEGDLPVGWCQVTPREAVSWLDRSKVLPRVDDVPVWAISCFYVRTGYRRRGVATALIDAAIEAAREAGAPALEAYPLDAEFTPSATSTGYTSTFRRAGFRVVARRGTPRPTMRIDLHKKTYTPIQRH